jgi:hypothetical protein
MTRIIQSQKRNLIVHVASAISLGASLVAEGFQRIDLRGAAGRSPARQQRHADE